MILHIGLAAGRNFYTLERQSPRGPFDQFADVDGRVFSALQASHLFAGCPAILKPTFDTDDLWRRWRTNVYDLTADLRPSDDPGRYLCGFIYYVSMAWFMKRKDEYKGERPVVFLHVPDLPSEAQVAQGREVAVGLIKGMVGSRLKLGVVDPLKPEDVVVDTTERFAWSGVSDIKS
jgi:pyroglutamyl-peptidase